MRIRKLLPALLGILVLQSCGEDNPNKGKPIVLGDSSTIVTETDPTYLQDFVADIKTQPQAQPVEQAQADTAAKQQAPKQEEPAKETQQTAEQPKQEAPTGKGLTMAFKEVTVFIPNISVRTYKQQDLTKANGASYELSSGNINGNQIKTSKGNVTRVSQRYQTIVVAKNELGTLVLESLSKLSDWQALKGGSNSYNISGLDARNLDYIKASPASIKNAVSRAARNKRMSRNTEQKWVNSVKNVRSANQKPLSVVLRSVMWKVEGKDEKGKPFQKQIRMDIPL